MLRSIQNNIDLLNTSADTLDTPMMPITEKDLDRVTNECYSMVTTRAGLSGAVAAVPMPGVELAADVAILLRLLPAISRRFGLSPEQIDQYEAQTKMFLYNVIVELGSKVAVKVITQEVVLYLLKRVGVNVAASTVTKYIPVVGQVAAAGLSFAAMKYIGDAHVADCRKLVERMHSRDVIAPAAA
jgi:hypothetical protein